MLIKYKINIASFMKISGSPIAYWVKPKIYNIFENNMPLELFSEPRQGLTTCDNDRFLRLWHEVSLFNIGFGISSHEESELAMKKWFPYNKGGEPRKWYGNNEYLVNWYLNGKEIKEFVSSKYESYTRTVKNIPYYFKKGMTWSAIANRFAVRAYDKGFIFADKGQAIFCDDEHYFYLIALLNSIYTTKILAILSPTIDFNCGYIKKIPFKVLLSNDIDYFAKENINISKQDWDKFEISWDFAKHPLI